MGRSECGGLSVETQGREETAAGSGTEGLLRGGAGRGQGCAGKRGTRWPAALSAGSGLSLEELRHAWLVPSASERTCRH